MYSNISEKYGCEWVAPERTGSRKVAEILSYFGFKNNNRPVFHFGQHFYSHRGPNEDYSHYKLICNARNPYARTVSIFKNLHHVNFDKKNKDKFKEYLTDKSKNRHTFDMVVNPTFTKNPDYIIRLEHILEDLLKLPFIFDVLTENQLEMLVSHGKPLDEWEEYYDQESKDIVYNLTKHHFLAWGYEK